jgi:hypothetical protein
VTSSLELPNWNEPLEAPERSLIEQATTGDVLDLPVGMAPAEDPVAADLDTMLAWGPDRTIRAKVLRHLLMASEWPVHTKGVWLRGVRIIGPLDLESATLRCPLVLKNCYLDNEGPVILDYATVSLLRLVGCRLAGLNADLLVVTKELDLGRSTFTGAVRLTGAQITGRLSFGGAKLNGSDRNGNALNAEAVRVGETVFFDTGFTAEHALRLFGADIKGALVLRGAKINGTDASGIALYADKVRVTGAVFLDKWFTAAGTVRFFGADIGGQLNCGGATINGADSSGNALLADRVKVGGAVLLNGGFTTVGAVRLLGGDITGELNCGRAVITSKTGQALVLDEVKVGGSVFLDQGFSTTGDVRLSQATIGGQLSCSGAQITGTDKGRGVLAADGVKVGGSVLLNKGFIAGGAVRLTGARIEGALSLHDARLADAEALLADGAKIGQQLVWDPTTAVTGIVDLERAQVHRLDDNWSRAGANWPTAGRLRLAGFVYDGFGGENLATCQQRLDWVRSQHRQPQLDKAARFDAQPYEQLARVYQQMGHESDARRVAIARRNDPRKYGGLGRLRWTGNWLLDVTIKHGYRPLRAVGMLAVVFVAAFLLSFVAQHKGVVAPVRDTSSLHPTPTALVCTRNYPCFYAFGYAIDLTIPIIKVGQADNWRMDGTASWGWVYVGGTWVITGLGWAFTTLAVVGYTGLIRKD